MPATPAWPPKSLPRLFVRQALAEGALVDLDAAQANYLGNVMRLGEGAELLVFDGSSGEWLARIAAAGKKRMTLAVERQDARARDDPGRLARLRAGEAGADRLAGRKGDRAGRRAADPGDDAAHDRRAREARTAGSDRDRSGGAMRSDAPAGDRRADAAQSICSPSGTRRGASTSLMRGAANRLPSVQAWTRPDPRRPGRRLHRRRASSVRGSRAAVADFARTAHSSRGNGRACGACQPIWRWPGTGAKRRRPMTTRTEDSYSRPIESRADLLSVFAGGEKPRERLAHRHRAREVRLPD